MRLLVISLLSILLLSRCTTDVDLTAPYKDITVVYGLLDQTNDIQFLKINKAFLGDAALADMAAVRDSIEYDTDQFLSKRVEVWDGPVLVDTYELKDSIVEAINSSPFYVEGITDPERVVYYFNPPTYFENHEYRVVIEIEGKDPVIGSTELISSSILPITKPRSNVPGSTNAGQNIKLADPNSSINGNYPNYNFKWGAEQGARIYEPKLEFRYIENVWTDENHTDLISSEEKTWLWDLGVVKTSNASGTDNLEKEINGEQFYIQLAQALEADPNITREVGVLDTEVAENHYSVFNFILLIGDEDYNSFLEFNEPVTSLAQERPQWSNVENGQGLFSSSLKQESINVKMNTTSVEELCAGQHTFMLNFCTKDLGFEGDLIFCN